MKIKFIKAHIFCTGLVQDFKQLIICFWTVFRSNLEASHSYQKEESSLFSLITYHIGKLQVM